MIDDIFQEFIQLGIKNNIFNDSCKLLKSLLMVKNMTLIDEEYSHIVKDKRKNVIGFVLPHTASFSYIIKYINSDRLYAVINEAFIKIEKNNPHLKGKLMSYEYVPRINQETNEAEMQTVVKELEDLCIDRELLVSILKRLNTIDNTEVNLLENFLNNNAHDLYIDYEINKEMKFKENRRTLFKGEIPISINNSLIFDRTFIIEQWIRRIIMFVLMTEYGEDWIKAFKDKDLLEYESMRKRLIGREIIEHKDDHILWYSTITYLGKFIEKNENIKEKIEKITKQDTHSISKSIFKIAGIRNEMAHNRTITSIMSEDYDINFDILRGVIENFKKNTIYSNLGEIISISNTLYTPYYKLIDYFEKINDNQFSRIGTQSFIKEEADYYSVILLPCPAINGEFIDTGIILERYSKLKDFIIAFYINKAVGEYQVIVPKITGKQKLVYESIIDTFFDIVPSIGTDTAYELQDPKYTCNPKIWFYENSTKDGLENELW